MWKNREEKSEVEKSISPKPAAATTRVAASRLDITLDLSDGKNFTTMEWLMVFVKVPL